MDNVAKDIAHKILSELIKIRQSLTNAPGQHNNTSVTPQGAPNKKDDSTDREISAIAHVPPSPANTNKAEQPWYKTMDGWKTLFECIAIPFAIGYAVVTFFQWRDLHHNFEVDERAWLKVDYAFSQNPSGLIILRITNVGKSPVLHSIADAVLEIVDSKRPPSFARFGPHSAQTGGFLFQGGEIPFNVNIPHDRDAPPPELSAGEIANLVAGKSYVAIFGQLVYWDQFGPHWMRFCNWKSYANTDAVFASGACINYNRVGDGRPPR